MMDGAAWCQNVSQIRLLLIWFQNVVGPFNVPSNPSEEDLWLILQDGRVLCDLISKISGVEYNFHNLPLPCDRVNMFLSAAADMKLPLFEATDLDEGCYSSSSCKRIIDCLLSLKNFQEMNELKEKPSNSPTDSRQHRSEHLENPGKLVDCSENGTQKGHLQPRRRWKIPSHENTPLTADPGLPSEQQSALPPMNSVYGPDSLITDGQPQTGPSPQHLQQINKKFHDILGINMKTDSNSEVESPLGKNLENVSMQSLSGFVTAVFGNKQQDDVARHVGNMLRKVLEELERCFTSQNQKVTKLKSMLKEHINRENKLASRAMLLETLATGAGEEVKLLSRHLQQIKIEYKRAEDDKEMKEAMIESMQKEKSECEVALENLKRELEEVVKADQERFRHLESEKIELEQTLKAKIHEKQTLLQESDKKIQELEAVIALEMETIKRKCEQYGYFINFQHQLLKDVKWVLHSLKQEVLFLKNGYEEDLKALEGQLCGLVHAAVSYHRVLAENRLLYNEVQDLKGNIRVYCRIRPFLLGQSTKHSTVEYVGENGDILICNPLKQQGKEVAKAFTFNKIFKPSSTQEEVFRDTRPLIRSVLDGFNVCIFAYGQTGSGKTYTMSGPSSSSDKDWGVNYRALNDLFEISRSRKDVINYEVGVQMIEIYNEQVRDLLFIDSSNRRLEIRNNSQLNGVNVPDASMLPVNSTFDVFHLMKIGQKNRAIGATALNERSSRSHSVLTVHVRGTELSSGAILHGCLHLVDLAGSERVDRSEATGDRLKEAQHINRSLSALGDVIAALAQRSSHVPYRNSKLTQLLQDSLGGQAKTLMFVHISPDIDSYGETLSTLKFAQRVASVELGAAKSNKESKELRDLKEQVASLKELVSKKDMEIDRLLKGKSRIKGISGSLFSESYLDMQDQRLRRQTLDSKQ
ncbi:hypothetical protein KP509_30G072200 [Ceratopteris richardii]|uniref:Uncharacterized protein n=1 Tax=Ceratopteris richardii TaxID=49495 RepID=A0A8T2R5X9_CERRI|nr:hypothetical protein KP509_30G072200 [Ceratopteris richardii]